MSFVQSAGIVNPQTDSKAYLDESQTFLTQRKTGKGISGFVFDIADSENVNLQSDITDHYVEDNTHLNDHIVRKPETLTLSGFVGELVYKPQESIIPYADIANRLTIVSGFLPELTPGMQQIATTAVQAATIAESSINQLIDKSQDLVGFFDGESSSFTLQMKAFVDLSRLWKTQDLLDVTTPWGYFQSMVIQNISFRQDGNSNEITDISVTLKRLRTTGVAITDFDTSADTVRTDIQGAETEEVGEIQGETFETDPNKSWLINIDDAVKENKK